MSHSFLLYTRWPFQAKVPKLNSIIVLKKGSYCDNEGLSFGPMRKGWNYAVIQIRVKHQGRGYSIGHSQQEVRNSLL